MDINLSYYSPINQEQKEFHASRAKHKLLMGGFGSGKTYPSLHESIFHCIDNPGHQYYMFKNTWDFVEEHLEEDTKRICDDCGLTKSWSAEKHNLTLYNDCVIKFRPLTLGKKKFKGINCCGFFVDDPDVAKYSELIAFLFSRLRNTPHAKAKRFQTIITANLEGRDWLYLTYMKNKLTGQDRPAGGDDKFAYWICPTDHNPTLPANFISDLEEMHSKEWMDRYVWCKMDSFIGRIYPSFDRGLHNMSREEMEKKPMFHRTLALDVGITHATAYLDMFTDGEAIYVIKEFYEKGLIAPQVGQQIVDERSKTIFQSMVIDPASAKTDQTSGTSVRSMLWDDFRLNFISATNDVNPGILICQDLIKPAKGAPKVYINLAECPHLVDELEIYRWKEPPDMDTDYMEYKPEPVKKRDDTCDAFRYGCQQLRRYMHRKHEDIQNNLDEERKRRWMLRFEKLPMYQKNQALAAKHAQKIDDQVDGDLYKRLGYPRLAKMAKRGYYKKKGRHLISGLF